ncbi:WlaTC/HtrL family glycosyltransferase [Neobacillus niacini]|uniref:WlaTC/HtrL family glycosyltransferase n=1 Tax=Neobacillus niacini TaxID=86668 RepID=UPI00203B27DB|nr:WlaTC/HtrL family glycosyltransferase [Neobacillus niacini]MCM3693203.1 hypothetical protein [Neobacillus niacini]
MSEITIVTAFLNIKRADWKTFSRNADEYISYFEFWARIRNKVIIYLDSKEVAAKVLKIREEYGLAEKTVINIVNDITELDKELYQSIKKATENGIQREFRVRSDNPESWNADYNYVMLLKEWFVKDAVQNKSASGMVAWLDFGFNHGGSLFDNASDFDFLWKYEFPEKINIFNIKELDDRPIFDIIRTMDTYIMGPIIVAPDYLWNELWELMRNAMLSLNYCGLVDDDQNIILMAYRMKPELFEVRKSNWFLPLKEYGGGHLQVRINKNSIKKYPILKPIRKIVRWLRKTKMNMKYLIKEFKVLQKTDL